MEHELIHDGDRKSLLRALAVRTAIPSIWHAGAGGRHGGIVRTTAIDERGQCTWRDERKWREKANVPFHLAFTLRDLGERAKRRSTEAVKVDD